MIAFDFIIIYRKKTKNLIDGLFRRFDFKDDNELFTTRRQLLSNFLSKFQEYLGNTKNNLIEEQSIDSDETLLFKSVLNLIGISQDINSIGVLSTRNESKSDPTKEQNIDSDETPLLGSVLNLTRAP